MNVSSAGNIDNFKQSFREEAREITVELEATLLELHENPDDPQLVGKAFRGLHTIKGSGAMFGFDKLAAFTHDLENAYDAVRNGTLAVTPALIDLTLASLDQIKLMIEEGVSSAVSDPGIRMDLLAQVRKLLGRDTPALAEAAAHSPAPAASPVPPADSAASPMRQWRIHFAPGPELMRDGTNPLLLLNEVRRLGSVEIHADISALPPLSELDPERCYVGWDMTLTSACDADTIRDIFIFVEETCELSIDGLSPDHLHADELGLGRIHTEAVAHAEETGAIHKGMEEPRADSGGRRTYDKPDIATSIRVPAKKLDQFVDLVGELVTVQARLSEIAMRRGEQEVVEVSEQIERLTAALRENSMNIRMLPIRSTFERFRRLVHDLARDLHKEVELNIQGADTELDKTVIDQLSDPLMHLIRNSMDHGIEPPAARLDVGKRSTARIQLSARYSGANVLVSVSDDGRGINAEAVRKRGIERGLITAEMPLTEADIFALIFEPGFSTAAQVTDVSGRGVGMDVVRQRVESLRGSIEVVSNAGQGTSVTLRLPLTLAIIDGLLVSVDDAYYVLPLANTLECIELTRADIELANGKHVANVRGEIVPYIRLRQHFNIRTECPDREQIMIVETEDGRYGFVVDRVLGDYQTVIKNLGKLYRHVQIISGATILGDGKIALILDPNRLVQEAFRTSALGLSPHARAASRPPPSGIKAMAAP